MSVARAWLRGLLRASGVTLLVPVGLLAAVAVAATLGGSGLGSVGQLVGGPEVPGAEQRAAAPVRQDEELPAVPARTRRARQSERRTTAARTPAPTTTTRRSTTPRRRTPSRPVATKGPSTSRPTTTPTVTAPPTPTPAPTTPTETNPIRQVGGAVQKLVEPLPVVGPVASDAVGTVIDLLAPGK